MYISVGTLNAVACQQLDKLQHDYPIITKPTEEVCQADIHTFHMVSVNLSEYRSSLLL